MNGFEALPTNNPDSEIRQCVSSEITAGFNMITNLKEKQKKTNNEQPKIKKKNLPVKVGNS